MSGQAAVVRVLGSPPVASVARRLGARRLRVLAYHDVTDARAFRAQLEQLCEWFTPVSGAAVADALAGGRPLPERAVWVTFDDGRPGVVRVAKPELDRLGVPATLFVCPGAVEDGSPYWFDVVAAAASLPGGLEVGSRRWTDATLVTHLKSVPDEERREVARRAIAALERAGVRAPRQLTVDELHDWVASDRELGNHTWDHPCLDRCTPDEQRRQLLDAHGWLTGLLGRPPTLFAYPNGDWTPDAEAVLAGAGYAVAALFDHHVVGRRPAPLRLSRLRVDASVPPVRFRAIVTGAHSAVFGAASRVRSVASRRGS